MPTFRGNRGNLLQHWVLVELLDALHHKHVSELCFVDAYSMSPRPTRSPKVVTDQTAADFDRVLARLKQGPSAYERAWLSLSRSLGSDYPSSASFVRHCWEGQAHLLLCEADRDTASDIATWLSGVDASTTSFELYQGDWRGRFRRGIPTTFGAYYLSFDPNMYDRHDVRIPKPENMYPSDLPIVTAAIEGILELPIVIQLSTYSVNGANGQPDVFDNVAPVFSRHRFEAGYVRADNAMMSMLFTRGTPMVSDLENRFRSWLTGRKG